jgi:type VI secretion system secreted protein VgrG
MSKGQPVRLKSPLAEDLLFKSMDLSEELGRLFVCELEVYSAQEDINLDDLLAHEMTVEIDLENGGKRHVHGYVTDMTLTGRQAGYVTYDITLRPWLWFLTRTADCRIFQGLKAPDIIKKVFRDHGFSDFRESLSATYRVWEYCVQYRETDFNFVSRLMEQEGIYYFFEETEDGKHMLVLADSPGAHTPIKGYEKVPYFPPSDNVVREEHISDWTLTKSVQPGKYGIGAFHFKKPKTKLEAYASISYPHPRADYEFFDYPGEHYEMAEGKHYATVRMEELASDHECVTGETDAMGLFAGGLFELAGFPRQDQNREYLIVAARHQLTLGGYESGDHERDGDFDCSFDAVPSDVHFRASRSTPKPAMQGPQTAIVVGVSGEEIDTDEFGRVKVQFRWDRLGKPDENASCWVRVAQVWAGAGWGGMAIPRIGQEVIVDFIEGDPDRPIVTGRVYNAENMPPYELPANKTRTTIKSRSTKGGAEENFNEIRFEDKKGTEEMYIHAEKDQNLVVENNQTIKVGFEKKDKGDRTEAIYNDRSLDVGRDKLEKVGRNKSILVKSNHDEKIDKNMSVMVGSNLSETVAINYSETVGAAMELSVGAIMTINVGAALTETVGLGKAETIGAAKSENIGTNKSVDIGKALTEKIGTTRSVDVGKDDTAKIGGKQNVSVTKEYALKAKVVQIVADDEISLKSGSAEIILKKNGDITIKGNAINIKGSSDVVIKGSTIKEN